jgi:putative FmdB family regulatory protein
MPRYDYECDTCGKIFEATHGYNDASPACPDGHATVHRIITTVPRLMKGMAAAASKNASKEELQSKWAEETPKLRKQLADKLGEETVSKYGGTLNHNYGTD